jgi:hypothetical protein
MTHSLIHKPAPLPDIVIARGRSHERYSAKHMTGANSMTLPVPTRATCGELALAAESREEPVAAGPCASSAWIRGDGIDPAKASALPARRNGSGRQRTSPSRGRPRPHPRARSPCKPCPAWSSLHRRRPCRIPTTGITAAAISCPGQPDRVIPACMPQAADNFGHQIWSRLHRSSRRPSSACICPTADPDAAFRQDLHLPPKGNVPEIHVALGNEPHGQHVPPFGKATSARFFTPSQGCQCRHGIGRVLRACDRQQTAKRPRPSSAQARTPPRFAAERKSTG